MIRFLRLTLIFFVLIMLGVVAILIRDPTIWTGVA